MDSELKLVHNIADPIEGWLTGLEGELLYRLARQCTGRGVIVEIGSYKGKSTVWLAQGSKAGGKVPIYAVDPHTGSPEYGQGDVPGTFDAFRRNIQTAGVSDIIFPIVSTSSEAVRSFQKPVELLFIDGSHAYEAVKNDFEVWFPKLIEGGHIVFHDSVISPGPAKVVKERVYISPNFADARFVHSTTYAKKVAANTQSDRNQNQRMLILKNLYAIATRIPLPSKIKRLCGDLIRSL